MAQGSSPGHHALGPPLTCPRPSSSSTPSGRPLWTDVVLTVLILLDKLPDLLQSVTSSIKRIIIHIGLNDTALQHSELAKNDFTKIFNLLTWIRIPVFITGLIFSRILALLTWLKSTCIQKIIAFIDNFNVFWNRKSFFSLDGIHPNMLDSPILAGNIQHAVQRHPVPTY